MGMHVAAVAVWPALVPDTVAAVVVGNPCRGGGLLTRFSRQGHEL